MDKKRGPKFKFGKKRAVIITCSLPENYKKLIKSHAKKLNISSSNFVFKAIESYINGGMKND